MIDLIPLKYMLGYQLHNANMLPQNERYVYNFSGASYIQLDSTITLDTGDYITLSFFADYNSANDVSFVGGTTKQSQISAFVDDSGLWSLDNCTATLDGVAISDGDAYVYDSKIHTLTVTATSDSLTISKIGADYDGTQIFSSAIWNVDVNGEHYYSIDSGENSITDSVGSIDGSFVNYDANYWLDVIRYRWIYDFNSESGIQLDTPIDTVKKSDISIDFRAGEVTGTHTIIMSSSGATDEMYVMVTAGEVWAISGCTVLLDGVEISDLDSYVADGISHTLTITPDSNQSDVEFIGCISGGANCWMDYLYNVTIEDSYFPIDGGFSAGGVVSDENGVQDGTFLNEVESNWNYLPYEFYVYNFDGASHIALSQSISLDSGERVIFRFRAGDYVDYSYKTFFDSESATNRTSVRLNGSKQWDIVGGTAKLDGVTITTGTTFDDDGEFHEIEFTSTTDGGNVKYIGCNYLGSSRWYDFIRNVQIGVSTFYYINEGPDGNGDVIDLYDNVPASFVNYDSDLWSYIEL